MLEEDARKQKETESMQTQEERGERVKAKEGTEADYAVWFGGTETGGAVTPTGSDGKFSFKGQLSVYPTGGGVNEVVGMNITIAPTSVITLDDGE